MEDPLGSVNSTCLLACECITSASQLPALFVSRAVLRHGQPGSMFPGVGLFSS